MEFYLGSKRNVNKGYWISFENHPRLEETKKKIYTRCLPCLEKLYLQLQHETSLLELDEPLSCWKVVVALESDEECFELLEAYQEDKFPISFSLRGRIGTADREKKGAVLLFHLHEEEQRDEVYSDMERLAKKVNPNFVLFIERGCGDLYGTLCGDWRKWKKETRILNPSLLPVVRERVRSLLKK